MSKTAIEKIGPEFAARLLRWYRLHKRDLPWRHTSDPYAVWVSEVMLQQTTVNAVIPFYEKWMGLFPDVRTLARAPLKKILKAWQGWAITSEPAIWAPRPKSSSPGTEGVCPKTRRPCEPCPASANIRRRRSSASPSDGEPARRRQRPARPDAT